MSFMQALQLLKFVKGVTKVYAGKSLGPQSKPVWRWLIQVNEGGTPINFTIGHYTQQYQKAWNRPKLFFYVCILGKRWMTK